MNKPQAEQVVKQILQAPIGSYIGEEGAQVLAQRAARIEKLKDGEFLYRQGDAANSFYMVTSGRLGLIRENQKTGKGTLLHVLEEGDLTGELSFIDGEPRSLSVEAFGDASVLCFDRQDIEPLIDEYPKVIFNFMRAVVKRVHHTVSAIGQQQSELSHYIATGGRGRS
ncbi:Crp/Fnr family transcriptional regulator [Vibrio hepatarius]|uniref:Crp/Fnr family transcriptional regulator n=1 Tax=Vibrio hepatarius TaxID=171383 RepID=UPI00142E5877|nr:cyclic nucleotide-binding domain-containing protein [Vibrio hepatarius]NIY84743.1 cyclic nucleotide-binding domain-containing protein [Vibrio hepatarius]NVJ57818.1 cyclic nucleotide-binding domain-containing protein [Vibrionaceae bacterium]